MVKNALFASPAIAFAAKVLPVPGGPHIKIPRVFYRLGVDIYLAREESPTNLMYLLSLHQQPATSAKVVFT